MIAVTQRLDYFESTHEWRNTLDQRWFRFLEACHLVPILVPNHLPTAKQLIETLPLKGILLTGGNDLGSVPERDAVEHWLLEYAMLQDLPVLGVCRGMQFIQDYCRVPLEQVSGHITPSMEIMLINQESFITNSYHRFGSKITVPELEVWASSHDGVIKAIRHSRFNLTGIMWHPERNLPFHDFDLALFHEVFRLT